MIRALLLSLMLFAILQSHAEVYSLQILGNTYEDSSRVNIENVYQQVLATSTYFKSRDGIANGTPKERKHENKTGVFFISILLLYAFAGVRLMFSHQFAGSLDMIKNLNAKRKSQSESDSFSMISFYALYLITLGYILYFFLHQYHDYFVKMPTILGVLLCIALVTVLYLLKTTFVYFVAWTFDKSELLSQYFGQVSMINKVAAIVLFPLTILMLISSSTMAIILLKLSIGIFTLAILLRYVKAIPVIKKLLSIHFLHFIMYLCAFEIIPMLILIKYLR